MVALITSVAAVIQLLINAWQTNRRDQRDEERHRETLTMEERVRSVDDEREDRALRLEALSRALDAASTFLAHPGMSRSDVFLLSDPGGPLAAYRAVLTTWAQALLVVDDEQAAILRTALRELRPLVEYSEASLAAAAVARHYDALLGLVDAPHDR